MSIHMFEYMTAKCIRSLYFIDIEKWERAILLSANHQHSIKKAR